MLVRTAKELATKCCENFEARNSEYARRDSFASAIVNVILLISVIVILMFIGTFLWNNFLAGGSGPGGVHGKGFITVIKPIDEFWKILGVYLLVQLLFGGL